MRKRKRWKEISEEKQSWKDPLPDYKSLMTPPDNWLCYRGLCRERHHGGPGEHFHVERNRHETSRQTNART